MTLIDRYIARSIAWSSMFVALVLLTLFVFIDFIGELRSVGKGNYGVLEALVYVMLTLPGLLYQLFPVLALLGTLVGLALLANNSELVAIRAAGVSIWRIFGSVSVIGLLFVVLSFALGEWLAPKAELLAESYKSRMQSGSAPTRTEEGYWLRDGNHFVYIEAVGKSGQPGGMRIFSVDEDSLAVTQSLHAQTAVPLGENWQLGDVDIISLSLAGISSRHVKIMPWDSLPEPELVSAAATQPQQLSLWSLIKYVGYLRDNGLRALQYEQALLAKIVAPFTVAVMVLLAFPFIFGSLRSAGVGHYVFIGACVGIGFHLLNELARYSGLVYGLSPWLSTTAPTLLFLGMALFFLRRVF